MYEYSDPLYPSGLDENTNMSLDDINKQLSDDNFSIKIDGPHNRVDKNDKKYIAFDMIIRDTVKSKIHPEGRHVTKYEIKTDNFDDALSYVNRWVKSPVGKTTMRNYLKGVDEYESKL